MMKLNTYRVMMSIALAMAMWLWSCSSPEMESAKMTDQMVVEEAVEAVEEAEEMASNQIEPSADQFVGYESRGMQKLADLSEYISFISNLEYDRALREHMVEQAIELFETEKSVVEMNGYGLDFTTVLSVENFLKGALNNEYGLVTASVDDMRFYVAFQPVNDSIYEGEILFTQNVQRIIEDEIAISSEEKSAKIVLKQVTIQFGSESEEVWQVLIRDIK